MNEALNTHTIYLIGIGGIGMSALARYFRQQGKEVSGYDRTSTPLTRQLESEGMNIHYNDDPAYVPCDVGLVIYTPAIPPNNRELTYCREIDVPVKKRAEVLEMIAEEFKTIAVAGTHGKTSITSMIAQIMHHNEFPVNAFVGGIMKNNNSNMMRSGASEHLLAEADEYDRSFLRLKPYVAVISAIAPDHLDIYGSKEELIKSFNEFVSNTREDGIAIIHESITGTFDFTGNILSYGTDKNAGIGAENIRVENHRYRFGLRYKKERIEVMMQVPGRYNIANACAAAGVCLSLGMSMDQVKDGLESYSGVRRRFEYILRDEERVYIDDYAHHPEEIIACIETARELYPGKKLTGIFQPHLYSRTRDFANEFADSLSKLDEVMLLDIYPARESPIEGVNVQMIYDKIEGKNKYIYSEEALLHALAEGIYEVVLSMGAGDIDKLVEPIKERLKGQG